MSTSHPLIDVFLAPLRDNRPLLIKIVLSASIVSLTHGLIVFFVGPLLKLLFTPDSTTGSFTTDYLNTTVQIGWKAYLAELSPVTLATIISGGLCLVAIVRGFSLYTLLLSQEKLSLYAAHLLRTNLYSAILKKTYDDLSKHNAAHWMSLIMNDVMFLQQRFSDLLRAFVKDGFACIGAFFALAIIDIQATALLLCGVLPLAMITGSIGKKIANQIRRCQSLLSEMIERTLDSRRRFLHLKAQTGEKIESQAFSEINSKYLKEIKKSIPYRSAFAPGLEFCGLAALSVFLYIYTKPGSSQTHSPEFLFQFLAAIGIAIRPIRNIGEQFSKLHETSGALTRCTLILDNPTPNLSPFISPATTDRNLTGIQIDHLELTYKNDTEGCKASQIKIPFPSFVALIGPSGAGKSSFVKCLCGLYKPTVWDSLIEWERLSALTSMVGQNPFLFRGTIRENLVYGLQREPSDSELKKVLKAVQLEELTNSIEKIVGSISGGLSGGQQQRLLLARSILRNAKIHIFDEITSGLDQQNELEILNLLKQLSLDKNLIIFLVSHRTQNLKLFDQVMFFENQTLVLNGPHESLIKTKRYQRFIGQNIS